MSQSPHNRYKGLAEELCAPVVVGKVALRPEQKGCFAARALSPGEVLWLEAPMLSIQHAANRSAATVCAECCRWVGDADAVLGGVIQWATQGQIPTAPSPSSRDLPVPAGALRCKAACGAVYCSAECRSVAWQMHHRMLCTGCGDAGTPELLSKGAALHRGALLCYEQLADKMGCRELLDLLARSVVDILGGWETNGRDGPALAAAAAPYDTLYTILWWAVPGRGSEAELRPLVAEAARLLDLALLPCHRREIPALFSVDRFAQLLGGFESNLMSVEIECPAIKQLVQSEFNVLGHADEGTHTDASEAFPKGLLQRAAVAVSKRVVSESVGQVPSPTNLVALSEMQKQTASDRWPRSEGVALFDLISTMNHSCVPSCAISYDDCHVAHVTALRPIEAGQELLICYVDESANVDQRQSQLLEYGFTCVCEQCCTDRAGKGQPK
jgi:hypothetical protein